MRDGRRCLTLTRSGRRRAVRPKNIASSPSKTLSHATRSVDLTAAHSCYRVDEVVRIVSRSEVVTTSHVLRRNTPDHASPTVSFFDSMGESARNVCVCVSYNQGHITLRAYNDQLHPTDPRPSNPRPAAVGTGKPAGNTDPLARASACNDARYMMPLPRHVCVCELQSGARVCVCEPASERLNAGILVPHCGIARRWV
jgi:hypothetical protein